MSLFQSVNLCINNLIILQILNTVLVKENTQNIPLDVKAYEVI